MLRIFLFALFILFAAITGMIARRIYVDQNAARGFASLYVGGQIVTVDRAMIRNPDLRDGGAVNRLDLVLTWPDFRPAGAQLHDPDRDLVFVAIEDATVRTKSPDDIDPADRPNALYSRFLEQEAWSNPGGLVMRRFKAGTPYEGEELYVSSPDERVFSARCPKAGSSSAPDDLCLWQTRINGLEVHVRFAARYLTRWTSLAEGVRSLIPRIAQPKK